MSDQKEDPKKAPVRPEIEARPAVCRSSDGAYYQDESRDPEYLKLLVDRD